MNASPIDVASEYDRLWFEKHPDEDSYVRRRVSGEFGPVETEDPRWPIDECPWVEVTQLRPGVRARQPFIHHEILSMS